MNKTVLTDKQLVDKLFIRELISGKDDLIRELEVKLWEINSDLRKWHGFYRALPALREYNSPKDFMFEEEQMKSNAEIDGWNECVRAIQEATRYPG